MAFVRVARPKSGDELVNIQEKLFPDHKAKPGEKACVLMHTVPFEGSVGLVNMLVTTRLVRKGFDVSMILYGPGILMAAAGRGFPQVGVEGFPGNLNFNKQLAVIMKEGGKIYMCRFAMQALYGFREDDVMEGIIPMHPLDMLDLLIEQWRAGAFTVDTWTL
jgi:uncharacterized repeat protein (TIGR04044 family)